MSPSAASIPTKHQAVYDALRADIVSGDLAPGQTLVIDNLAKRFAVSIIPVREALRQLQMEGLVEIRPHTGTRVAPVDPAALEEIFAMLTALEIASARVAVERLDDAGLALLQTCLDDLERAAAQQDIPAFEQANRRFHLLPCQIAGYPRFEQALRSVFAEWERLHRLAFRSAQPPDLKKANREHRAMVRAFRARSGEEIVMLINRHNDSAARHYRKTRNALD